jgi:hypothetical protein
MTTSLIWSAGKKRWTLFPDENDKVARPPSPRMIKRRDEPILFRKFLVSNATQAQVERSQKRIEELEKSG